MNKAFFSSKYFRYGAIAVLSAILVWIAASTSYGKKIVKLEDAKAKVEIAYIKDLATAQGVADSATTQLAVAIVERDNERTRRIELEAQGPIVQTVTITKIIEVDKTQWVPKLDFDKANKCCQDNAKLILALKSEISLTEGVEAGYKSKIAALDELIKVKDKYILDLDDKYNRAIKLAKRGWSAVIGSYIGIDKDGKASYGIGATFGKRVW